MNQTVLIRSNLLLLLFVLSSFANLSAMPEDELDHFARNDIGVRDSNTVRIVFYNVENLFDIYDDSLHNDEAFLPGNIRGWTYGRFLTKLNHIYQVVAAIGGWRPPEIIGLAEIENKGCTAQLLSKTPLGNAGYRIIQDASPDFRGIEVSLLYDPKRFIPTTYRCLKVAFPFSGSTTRDVLYVSGVIGGEHRIHLYICHWPSKYGGEVATMEKRNYVAALIRDHIDSIAKTDSLAHFIVMGDLNDEPDSEAVMDFLGAKAPSDSSSFLINLMGGKKPWEGSHKHQGHWGYLDQIIVSSNFLGGRNGLQVRNETAEVFDPEWLLEKDELHLGVKPYRTYIGMTYHGGYSDHLPVFIDVLWED